MTPVNQNSNALFRTLTGLQWLALLVIALMFASVWPELPARMATHFDLANQPNGWMSRQEALIVMLGITTFVLILSTWISSRIVEPDASGWGILGLFYVVLATLVWASHTMLDYNLLGTPVQVAPILLVGMVAAILLVILVLGTSRGTELPAARTFARETHASAFWALVTGAPVILLISVAAVAAAPAVKLALGLATLLGLGAAAMAAFGFQYIFSAAGVDIRTMGFRLRSIAAPEIRSYEVSDWPLLNGRGIRGVGNRRAYVWGNTGVRIQTSNGEVFLGHKQPQRIVRDLDRVVQSRRPDEGIRST